MPARRVPVLVVAGFLGSGKTTLLNHLLNNSGSTRIGVVVNDFGAINIDAMAVAGQVDSGVALSNGCLCCAIDPRDLDRTLHRLSKPSSGIDVIVVEASGLADPREIVRMLLASTDRNISYGGLVELVDAVEFETTMAGHPEFITHIDFADLVLLNKTDRVTPTTRAGIQERISTISPGKPVVCTEHGRVDPELLFDRRHHQRRGQLSFDDLHDHHGHTHTAYESVAFTSTDPLNPRRLMEFLNQRPRGLYRIKGNVHFGIDGHRQKFVLHTVGSYLRFRTTRWERGESRATNLVAIGSDIDRDSVTERLHACVRSRAETTDDERAMLEVLRFTEN